MAFQLGCGRMKDEGNPRSDKLAAKDYLALGFSAFALIISGAGFYFQFLKESYTLYVGISDVRISLAPSSRAAATFLFSNRGNQQAIIVMLNADVYPAAESFGTDNCKLPQIKRIASLRWAELSSAVGTAKASPILLKPNDIAAYSIEFSGLSQDEQARAVAKGHGNLFLLVCWSATYYSPEGFIAIKHFAATVNRFNDIEELQEQRTPTSLMLLRP